MLLAQKYLEIVRLHAGKYDGVRLTNNLLASCVR